MKEVLPERLSLHKSDAEDDVLIVSIERRGPDIFARTSSFCCHFWVIFHGPFAFLGFHEKQRLQQTSVEM